MVYFDNAATTYPKPLAVRNAVMKAFTHYGANPGRSGHRLAIETAVKVFEAREALAEFLGAETVEDVVFTSNCTHALNIAIKGLLKHGDHVIISDLEHNSVLRPVHALAAAGKITYDVAATFEDDDETVASFEKRILPSTRLIISTHASNVWGIKLPIEKLGALCERHDILFMVDAAQTAGVVPINVAQCGIDFLCTAGHKSLMGPSGTGVLVTPLGSAIDCLFEGGTGSMSSELLQPVGMPERLESGTCNTIGIIGLGAGVKYVDTIGVDNIYNHEFEIAKFIYNELRNIDKVKLYTRDFVHGRHMPVVSFNIDGIHSEELAETLSDSGFATRAGLHCAPLAHRKMGTIDTGATRISIGHSNSIKEARAIVSTINALAKK